jgi:predicted nucleic acid-binding protein
LTGSIGILLKARAEGKLNSVEDTMIKMRNEGIWISDRVVAKAIEIERGLK